MITFLLTHFHVNKFNLETSICYWKIVTDLDTQQFKLADSNLLNEHVLDEISTIGPPRIWNLF